MQYPLFYRVGDLVRVTPFTSRAFWWRVIRTGGIPSTTIGKTVVVPHDALVAWLNASSEHTAKSRRHEHRKAV